MLPPSDSDEDDEDEAPAPKKGGQVHTPAPLSETYRKSVHNKVVKGFWTCNTLVDLLLLLQRPYIAAFS